MVEKVHIICLNTCNATM